MSTSALDKPVLWSYSEAAKLLGLNGSNDHKGISVAVRAMGITPKTMNNGKSKGLDREDLDRLASAFNRTL